MNRIQMKTPLVEMDGDEMTRVLWQMIKEKLLLPYVELKTEYYDLGLKKRDETDDEITVLSAQATKKYGVAVKCATITPNADRVKEYGLKKMWKSPNGTIRALLDGTVFRTPILVRGIEPNVRSWKAPITIARHAYGDVYKNAEIRIPSAGRAELVFTAKDGSQVRELIHDFEAPGVIQGIHNTVFLMRFQRKNRFGLEPRIRFRRFMTPDFGRFLIRFIRKNLKRLLKEKASTTFTP